MIYKKYLLTALKFFVLVLLAVSINSVDAAAKSKKAKKKTARKPAPSLVVDNNARYSAIVIEARTGRVLHSENPDDIRYPASLTKMMTLYITFQALEAGKLRLDQWLPVSYNAASQPPSKLGLKAGKSIKVQDAILALTTESANDAAVVLAEAIAGSCSNFSQLMTRQARVLGMNQTVFKNPNGLPNDEQVTTARDMAVLGHAIIYHYPAFYEYFGRDKFYYSGVVHRNHNRLMERYDGMDGIKTGYIRASGFNLVASAVRGQSRLIGVVFGGRSTTTRDRQMAKLLDSSFAVLSIGDPRSFGEEAQGDADDAVGENYIALPQKISAVFPSPRRQQENAYQRNYEAYNSFNEKEADKEPAVNWGIQIGAYDSEDGGRRALTSMSRNLAQLVSNTDHILQRVHTSDGNIIYRARFMGMEQRTARSICSYLVRHGKGCLVIAPSGT